MPPTTRRLGTDRHADAARMATLTFFCAGDDGDHETCERARCGGECGCHTDPWPFPHGDD